MADKTGAKWNVGLEVLNAGLYAGDFGMISARNGALCARPKLPQLHLASRAGAVWQTGGMSFRRRAGGLPQSGKKGTNSREAEKGQKPSSRLQTAFCFKSCGCQPKGLYLITSDSPLSTRKGNFSHLQPPLAILKPTSFLYYHYHKVWREGNICKVELKRLFENSNKPPSRFLWGRWLSSGLVFAHPECPPTSRTSPHDYCG